MEQSTNTGILVENINFNMAANMATKKLKYVYLSSQCSYKDKWGVDFDDFKVMDSVLRSGNILEIYFKMAARIYSMTLMLSKI